jgi:predicted nucleic acid-binding protein
MRMIVAKARTSTARSRYSGGDATIELALFLDTSVVIDLLRGAPYTESLIARRPLFVSPITIHGVVRGMRPGEEGETFDLFAALRVAPIRQQEGALSAHWRRELAAEGVTLHLADSLIAAGAAFQGLPLATGNAKHFPMPELRVEQWPPPPV